MIQLADLVEGKVYLFKYSYKSGNGRMLHYEMGATFVALTRSSPMRQQVIVSLRPHAGTQHLPKEWLTDIQEADKVFMPRRQKPKPKPKPNDGPEGLKDLLRFR